MADADASIVSGIGGARSAPGYRTLVNPGTVALSRFIAPIEGDEDVVRFKWSSIPDGAIPEHSHPHQEAKLFGVRADDKRWPSQESDADPCPQTPVQT